MGSNRRSRSAATTALVALVFSASFAQDGTARPVGGETRIRLEDGTVLGTHADPFVPLRAPSLGATRDAITCVARATEHFEAIVARAADDRERPVRDTTGLFRQAIYDASLKMDEEARSVDRDARARYRAACTPAGDIVVHQAVLPTPMAWDSFDTITTDLVDLGFDRPKTKYLIFYDDCASYEPGSGVCFNGGQALRATDDRLTSRNRANRYGAYGIDFGAPGKEPPSWFVTLHESGHTMGALQESAPHYSGNGHCWDGFDVMCYSDGGYNSASYNEDACPRPVRHIGVEGEPGVLYPWDCGHDDYFNPAPRGQNYLVTHWNLAHRYNRYLDHG